MHYNLLFNGCSCTFGDELKGINKDIEHQKTHRFSYLVSKELGMTYENISKPGKSNDWIVEETVNWFERGNTCDLAIIQLTDDQRITLYNTSNGKGITEVDIIQPSPVVLSKYFYSSGFDAKRVKTNIYFKNIYHKYFGQQNFYKNLFFINAHLKSKNVPVIFLKLKKEIEEHDNLGWKLLCENIKIQNIGGGILPNLRDDVEKKYFCRDYTNKYKEKKDSYFLQFTGSHPNELGHQKISEYIINEIQSQNIINAL